MKYTATNTLTLLLFLMCQAIYSESNIGTVPFDCPDVSPSRFQFDVDRDVIGLIMEDPTSDLPPVFKSVNNLYLRNYRHRSGNFKKLVEYYSGVLSERGWHGLGPKSRVDPDKDDLYLSIVHRDETVSGVFVIVKSGNGVYAINIVGEIPLGQLGPLLQNLNELGIEIQELMSLRPDDLQPTTAPSTATSKPLKPNPDSPITDKNKTAEPAFRTSKQKVSILKSMQINHSRELIEVKNVFVPHWADVEGPPATTRFMARDVPIHELHIQGNQKISEARIRQALENASKDMDKALQTLFKAVPYFEEINLQVKEEGQRYIATITVTEKPLSTDAYLGFSPLMRFGFNRVTGWEIGTGFKVGRKRKEVGPLWMWHIMEEQSDQTSRLFGRVSYAFGNPHLHYRIGGIANWGKPYAWNIRMMAQTYRTTVAVAPELFPGYNNAWSIFGRILGTPDLQNYYLQQGAAVSLQWSPTLSTHSFNLTAMTESHASLRKSTDWFITNWRSTLRLRENPPITPGRMRSLIFQYDFNNRAETLGWHNTLLVEHSSPAVGSDFDFTRLQLHLRYTFPLANNRIRTRFLFGFSNATLPIQRQFVIDGMGGLRGYWRGQETTSEGIITYNDEYTSSPYAFTGDRGFLINVEYHYRLSNLFKPRLFEKFFVVAFLDEGQVWEASGAAYTFDPKANIGIGLQIGEDDTVTVVNINGLHSGADASVFRINIAKALESGRGIQMRVVWYHNF